MTNLNKYLTNKVFWLISSLIILGIVIIIILFNVDIKKSYSAILEVDDKKNMSLKFTTSNISLLTTQKDISISLEGKIYLLQNVEFTYQGNNVYRIDFQNNDLYQLIKTNSVYDVTIFSGSKKVIHYIFNI